MKKKTALKEAVTEETSPDNSGGVLEVSEKDNQKTDTSGIEEVTADQLAGESGDLPQVNDQAIAAYSQAEDEKSDAKESGGNSKGDGSEYNGRKSSKGDVFDHKIHATKPGQAPKETKLGYWRRKAGRGKDSKNEVSGKQLPNQSEIINQEIETASIVSTSICFSALSLLGVDGDKSERKMLESEFERMYRATGKIPKAPAWLGPAVCVFAIYTAHKDEPKAKTKMEKIKEKCGDVWHKIKQRRIRVRDTPIRKEKDGPQDNKREN